MTRAAKPRPGRPPKKGGRAVQIGVCLERTERDALYKAAARDGISASAWAARAIRQALGLVE